MIMDKVRTRYAPSPTGFFILVEHEQHYLIIYLQNTIMAFSSLELRILTLKVMLLVGLNRNFPILND